MKKMILFFSLFVLSSSIFTQSIRPIRDDIGFCWNAEEMDRFVKWLDNNAEQKIYDSENLIAAISVHDDYLYAGKVYYPLFKQIHAKEVVIFGVTHGSVRKEMGSLKNVVILDEFDGWRGPYSNVKISPLREEIKSQLNKEDYLVSNKAHSIEHSIEALIPFLQHYNRDTKITPIMVTQMPLAKMEELSAVLSKIIFDYMKEHNLRLGKDIFILISNDANHYGEDFSNSPYGLDLKAHKTAIDNDRRIISVNLIGELDSQRIKKVPMEIWPDSTNQKPIPIWCGRYPIVLGLLTINKLVSELTGKSITGTLLKYSDSLTEKVIPFENTSMGLTAVFSPKHWCGWFTLGINKQ
jgi:MEMO1 family protein